MPDETAPPPAADTPPPSWTAGIFDTATPGALVPDWHTKAPEPTKWEPYKGAKTLDDLLSTAEKRVADAQTALRAKQAPAALPERPAADAAPEAWKAYREARGLPESPDGYGLARPEDFPEQLWNDSDAKAFAAWAHENDMPPEIVGKVSAWYNSKVRDGYADSQRQEAEQWQALHAQEAEALTKEFGPKLDDTLRRTAEVAEAAGLPKDWMDPKSKAFAGVAVVKMIDSLLKQIPRGEDGTRRNMGPGEGKIYDKVWAKEALKPGHPDHEAMTNPKHPRHEEVQRLRNLAYAA